MRRTILACALVALVVGGGSATAASLIGSSDVQNDSLRSVDVKNNTLRSKDVKNGTIKKRDLNRRLYDRLLNDDSESDSDNVVINAPKGDPGPTGAKGEQGPPGPAGVPGPRGTVVRNLSDPFFGTNASVTATLDGVSFGVYDDAGTGGSLYYSGANGQTLADITQLGFVIKHSSSDDSPTSTPYLRIFLEDDAHDVVFDPTECTAVVPDEDVFNSYEVTTGDALRYDDDACGASYDPQTWAQLVAEHGDEEIAGIYVTLGFSGGEDLSAILRSLSVNGTTYTFGSS